MKKVLVFLVFSVIFFSCDNAVESNYSEPKAGIIRVENVTIESNKILLTAIASWSNGCGKYSHYTASLTDNDIAVTVYGQNPTESACPTVMIEFEAPIEVVIDGTGEYNFSFWQTDSTTFDTTITVL